MKETILAIDIGSSKIATIIANHQNKNIDILGISLSSNYGINKGSIIDIEDLYISIKNAILDVKKNLPIHINKTLISISGKDSINIKSSGKINLPEKIITTREINQVLQTAYNNASLPFDYEMIHVIPKNFIVDNEICNNPLNIKANILEVQVNVIAIKKNVISNYKDIFSKLSLNNMQFILNSYASIFTLTTKEERLKGVALINLGAQTSELICIKENCYIYNNFLPVGSQNITNDLSLMLNISSEIADNMKLKYGSLLKNYKLLSEQQYAAQIKDNKNLDFSNIQTIIHARVEETLLLLRKQLKNSAYINDLNSGILITGGWANQIGIKELSQKIFEGIKINITVPNGFVNIDEHNFSSCIGLLKYLIELDNNIELDSNKRLSIPSENKEEKLEHQNEQNEVKPENVILEPIKPKNTSKLSALYKKLQEIF